MPAANIPQPISILDNDFDRYVMGAPSLEAEQAADQEFEGMLEELNVVHEMMNLRIAEEKLEKLKRLHGKQDKLRQKGEWEGPRQEGLQDEIDKIDGTGGDNGEKN